MLDSIHRFVTSTLVDSCFIDTHERAILVFNGRPRRLLRPGWRPVVPRLSKVIRLDISAGFCAAIPELVAVADREVEIVAVSDHELGLLRVDGRARTVLGPGRWALWNSREPVTLERVSTAGVHVSVPDEFRAMLPRAFVQVVHVEPQSEALLYVDDKFVERLRAGVHCISVHNRSVSARVYSTREQETVVAQQDISSKDKVSLRLSAVVRFRIVDGLETFSHSEDIQSVIYSDTQLALRRIVSERTLDELLEQRVECAQQLRDQLRERTRGKGVEILSAEPRDLGVPAAMRALLNRVIEATKQAEANLVHRREETAATRALANTARLLENNPTLARLKELEAWREIAARVGTINLVATPPGVLGAVLTGSAASSPPSDAPSAQPESFDE
ncbi:MAG: slipin family protein [Myxococcales bacterium]|nr:slipin family protein [Myxococcales bacterium]